MIPAMISVAGNIQAGPRYGQLRWSMPGRGFLKWRKAERQGRGAYCGRRTTRRHIAQSAGGDSSIGVQPLPRFD